MELNSAPKKAKPTLQLEVDGAILKEEDTVFAGRLKRSIALPESYWLKRKQNKNKKKHHEVRKKTKDNREAVSWKTIKAEKSEEQTSVEGRWHSRANKEFDIL